MTSVAILFRIVLDDQLNAVVSFFYHCYNKFMEKITSCRKNLKVYFQGLHGLDYSSGLGGMVNITVDWSMCHYC
jgi:hypothetical protein